MISVDTQEVIHITQMPLLLQRDFDQNLHQILGRLLERPVEESKPVLAVRLLAVVRALVLEDFGQGLLQEDYLVICLETEGIVHSFVECKQRS